MIILDTNVVSEPLRPAPQPAVVSWLDAQPIETLFLTAIGLAEVRFGIALLPGGRRSHQLHERFEGEVLPQFADRVVPFDADASAAYASLRARARRRGAAINDLDALIAGIAASRGFTVATRDTAPFSAVDVPVLNPFDR
jgi:predicted nucleic acid-binding protein